jgi:hypothetical protein
MLSKRNRVMEREDTKDVEEDTKEVHTKEDTKEEDTKEEDTKEDKVI